MNILDFPYILLEDKNTGKTYGRSNQLKVLGEIPELSSSNKMYAVECSICKLDPEVYKNGVFYYTIQNLNSGKLPCGCGVHPRHEDWQYAILCARESAKKGNKFVGFASKWENSNTIVILECPVHGIWETTTIVSLLQQSSGCKRCAGSERFTVGDNVLIERIRASGAFSKNDILTRSERLDKKGYKGWFNVYCSECNTEYESLVSCLKLGQKNCLCKRENQKFAYINLVYDGEIPVAVKFGITSNYILRQKHQSVNSRYTIEAYALWEFDSKYEARFAEKECLEIFDCAILKKEDFKDGYTETTSIKNLEKIEDVYRKHYGKDVTLEYYEELTKNSLEEIKLKIKKLIPKLDESYLEIKNQLMYIVGMADDTKAESV